MQPRTPAYCLTAYPNPGINNMRHFGLPRRIPDSLASILILISCFRTALACPLQTDLADLKTVAESSGFQATSRSDEVVRFVDACAQAGHVTRYDFGHSIEGRPLVAAVVARPPFRFDDSTDDRLRILLLGNIHSGECAGKEALLGLLRELALDEEHPWLSGAVVMIAPNYNTDANDRVGLNHRRGQVGPDAGMGVRENAQQLDLNRDFVKLESPEARGLVGLINAFDPHLFIDCHTTNGSLHQYALTYDIPHNPSSPQAIRDYLRNNMMPAVTRQLRQDGIKTWYYGNFSRDNSSWVTYGHEPRYSTEYVGLRGRLGILSEAYSYATYPERIAATAAFVRSCVQHVLDDAARVRKLLQDVRQQDRELARTSPGRRLVHLQSEMVAFPEKVIIEAFQDGQPHDYEVSFVGAFQPINSVEMPAWYALPAEMSLEAERLQMHGVRIEQLTVDTTVEARKYTIRDIRRGDFVFQGHQMTALEADSRTEPAILAAGTFVISTDQPLGRLAAYMLEPETNEGLVTWNFLDSRLAVGGDYPIIRVDQPIRFKTTIVDKITPGGKLKLADIYGPARFKLPEISLDEIKWLESGDGCVLQKNGRRIVVNAETGAEEPLPPALQRRPLTEAMATVADISPNDIREMLQGDVQLARRRSTPVRFVAR